LSSRKSMPPCRCLCCTAAALASFCCAIRSNTKNIIYWCDRAGASRQCPCR
jgi:hypothetical protein